MSRATASLAPRRSLPEPLLSFSSARDDALYNRKTGKMQRAEVERVQL